MVVVKFFTYQRFHYVVDDLETVQVKQFKNNHYTD